jgi:hypothetical protein
MLMNDNFDLNFSCIIIIIIGARLTVIIYIRNTFDVRLFWRLIHPKHYPRIKL